MFQALLASPDPEVQALAVTGMLESTQPKAKKRGFAGFLGQFDDSPTYQELSRLSKTPTMQEVRQPGLESRQVTTQTMQPAPSITQQVTTPPPTTAPLAQSATALTQVGAPPPQPLAWKTTQGPPTITRELGPRKLFPTPEESVRAASRAKAQGDVEGDVEGLVASGVPRAEALEVVKQERLRLARGGQTGQSYAEGNITADPSSPTGYSQVLYLRGDPTKQMKIPADPLAASSRGVNTQEAIAFREFGKPGEDPRATMKRLTKAEMATSLLKFQEYQAGQPMDTPQRFRAVSDLQTTWRKIEAPHREMERQVQLMETGLSRYPQDRIGGSQAVLVTFQKVLDPTSVVRESEYDRSSAALSIKQRMQGMYDRYIGQFDPATGKWVGGGAGIPESELREMVETARQFMQGLEGWNANERALLERTATEFQIRPDLVFGTSAAGGSVGTPPPRSAPGTAPSAPGTASAPAATSPGPEWEMKNGVLYHQGKPY